MESYGVVYSPLPQRISGSTNPVHHSTMVHWEYVFGCQGAAKILSQSSQLMSTSHSASARSSFEAWRSGSPKVEGPKESKESKSL